ncbi:hypothetical protein BY458DRAFT_441960, partial [Sporodiniella umbellata]
YISEDSIELLEETYIGSQTEEVVYNPIESIGSSFRIIPIGRSLSVLNQNDPHPKNRSFKAIQDQQLEDYQIKTMKPKRNLVLIQKEEQAVLELKESCIQTLIIGNGEWYEIQKQIKYV